MKDFEEPEVVCFCCPMMEAFGMTETACCGTATAALDPTTSHVGGVVPHKGARGGGLEDDGKDPFSAACSEREQWATQEGLSLCVPGERRGETECFLWDGGAWPMSPPHVCTKEGEGGSDCLHFMYDCMYIHGRFMCMFAVNFMSDQSQSAGLTRMGVSEGVVNCIYMSQSGGECGIDMACFPLT
mmetsp:Transcript_26783/g.52577  ORF Transcript_26783/g.52577 Transcript_26783/m.52577 type:complete len:185 (-) Transcript_26783:85-639(-)